MKRSITLLPATAALLATALLTTRCERRPLVDAGNTVVVIEHNLDVIKTADWIIDMGPEGGDEGGQVVFAGTPEDCVKCSESRTGQVLDEYFRSHPNQKL